MDKKIRPGDIIDPPYFDGVYPEGLEKEPFDDPFNSAGYQAFCRSQAKSLGMVRSAFLTKGSRFTRIEKALFYLHRPRIAARHLISGCACLAHLMPVAQMIRDVSMRNGKVRVLDVGGGYGDNFFHLLQVLPREIVASLEYEIVDNERGCVLGRSLFSRYEVRPSFSTEVPTKSHDIVIVVGTLQYIAGWREFLASIRARHIYLARTPIALTAGSFTTTQLICPKGRYLGPTRINVIGLANLRETMADWRPCLELMSEDYSTQFARLPKPYSDVRYFHMSWSR